MSFEMLNCTVYYVQAPEETMKDGMKLVDFFDPLSSMYKARPEYSVTHARHERLYYAFDNEQ